MADLLHNKLLHSLTSPSSRFPIFSFPLSLSPHSNFSTVRFIPPRWTRFSHSSVLSKLSPDSTQFDIISTYENSDGSVVFKFGDASEIRKSIENVDSRDANAEILVSDTKSEFVGRSIDEFDDNDVKSVETPGDECDVKYDVNDTKSEFVGRSDVKNDLTDVKEVLETAGDEHNAIDEKREVVGTLDGEIDARNEKSEIEGISDGKHYFRDEKSEVVGISDGDNDVNDTKSESVGREDVELDLNDVKEVLENAGDEFDAIIEKSEVKGTTDVSSEVVGALDSGTDASNEISEIEGTSDSKNYIRDEKSEVLGTPGDNDFVGRLDVELDVNDAKEVVENAGDEFDAISEKPEVQGTNDVRSEVVGTSDSGTDARYEKLEIEGALDSKKYTRVEKLEVVGTSDGDNDVDDPKSESVGRSDVELDLNDVKEVQESAGDEFDASDEKPEVQGTIDVRLGTSDGGTDARNEKLEIQETPDSKDYARNDKLEVAGTPDVDAVVNDMKSEFVGRSDVELDLTDNVKEVLETSGGLCDASYEKPKGQGTVDVKSDVIGTSEGESDARHEKLEIQTNEKLEIQRTPDSNLYADDEKSEVVWTSGGDDDGNVENLELIENADGECDDKSEVVGSSNGEHDGSSEKSVVIEDSVVGHDATDAKSEVLEASISECHIHDEKSMKVVSNNELFAHGAKSKVLETIDGENYVSDAESEPLGTSHGEHEMKLGTESISDAEPPKVKECHDTEVEHSIHGKPDSEETIVESTVQVMELVGSTGITNESFANSVTDFQSAAQSDGDSNVLSDKGDSVELMPQPAPLTDEEANSLDNSLVLESVLGAKMGNDVVPSTVAQPDDDPDVLKAVGSEASGVTLAETYIHSDKCIEVSPSELSISSAAVALSHPSEALTGGGDAYFVCQNWFGVADGVDQWSFEGITKGLYAQELMQNCEKLASNSQNAGLTNIKEVLQQSVAMTQSTGSATVLIANFDNEVLHVANIGDSGFVIIRNGAVLKKSSPMVHEFNFPYTITREDDSVEAAEEYHVQLEDGDVVITATDGLFDNLYEQEIASIVSKSMRAGMEPKDIAELLAVKAQEVGDSASARNPFADAAQAAGHGYIGGKLDHVTVVVSLVQIR